MVCLQSGDRRLPVFGADGASPAALAKASRGAARLQGQFCAVFQIPLPIFFLIPPLASIQEPVSCHQLLSISPAPSDCPQGCHPPAPLGMGIPVQAHAAAFVGMLLGWMIGECR